MSEWQAFDVGGLERIGRGTSAEVLALPPDHVLKLLLPGLGPEVAEREFAAARVAHAAGLPVAQPVALTRSADRYGMIFERLHESALARQLRRMPGPVMVTLAAMARLQARVHAVAIPAGALPHAHDLLDARCADADAPADARLEARRQLALLSKGNRLLHGDLHLRNLITAHGQAMAVDWAQAMAGEPAADVARTELLTRFGRYGPTLRRYPTLRVARHAAADWYLLCYRRITGMSADAIDAWRLPVAVAWLRADSAAHIPSLAAWVKRRLHDAQLR